MSVNTNHVYTSLATIASGPHARWRRTLTIALIPMLCAFVYFAYRSTALPSHKNSQYVMSLPSKPRRDTNC